MSRGRGGRSRRSWARITTWCRRRRLRGFSGASNGRIDRPARSHHLLSCSDGGPNSLLHRSLGLLHLLLHLGNLRCVARLLSLLNLLISCLLSCLLCRLLTCLPSLSLVRTLLSSYHGRRRGGSTGRRLHGCGGSSLLDLLDRLLNLRTDLGRS